VAKTTSLLLETAGLLRTRFFFLSVNQSRVRNWLFFSSAFALEPYRAFNKPTLSFQAVSPEPSLLLTMATRTPARKSRTSLSDDSDSTIDIGLSTSATARRLLEERGFRISSRTFDRSYALHWAAREGESAIVRMLLALFHGAELEPPCDRPAKKRKGCYDWASDGWTPLHSAASHG
jgi:Ankyrin repeats (3 copies)